MGPTSSEMADGPAFSEYIHLLRKRQYHATSPGAACPPRRLAANSAIQQIGAFHTRKTFPNRPIH